MEKALASQWKITMLLADSAQAIGGKLYILGGGWSMTGPAAPSAIAIKFEVPWDEANKKRKIRIELLNSDGQPVMVPGPVISQALVIETEAEVGRPPGITPGTPLDLPFAVNMSPLPLSAGRYEWRCTVAGVSQSCAFTVRAPKP